MAIHRLKTDQPFYGDVLAGRKNFEVRRDDRGFAPGDFLELAEVVTENGTVTETGRMAVAQVTYVLRGGRFGIEEGYAVLALRNVAPLQDKEKPE